MASTSPSSSSSSQEKTSAIEEILISELEEGEIRELGEHEMINSSQPTVAAPSATMETTSVPSGDFPLTSWPTADSTRPTNAGKLKSACRPKRKISVINAEDFLGGKQLARPKKIYLFVNFLGGNSSSSSSTNHDHPIAADKKELPVGKKQVSVLPLKETGSTDDLSCTLTLFDETWQVMESTSSSGSYVGKKQEVHDQSSSTTAQRLKSFRIYTPVEEEIERGFGVSTKLTLKLYEGPLTCK